MRARLAAAAGAVVAGTAAPAAAQQPPAGAPAGCTYDACALRRERVFAAERLLAGAQGAVVGRPRFFGTLPIDSIVRGVPEARPYARTYRVEQTRGQLLALAGTVVSVVALIDGATNNRGCAVVAGVATTCGGFDGRNTGLLVGGAVLGALGGWRLQVSDRALNRAVWWYNRALPR